MPTAYDYLRVSGDPQADRGTPIAGQRSAVERYATEHNIALLETFTDEARPGSNDGRAAFQRMMGQAYADPKPVDLILLWSWSRFSRDQDDAHFWKASLRRHGIEVIDVSGETPQVHGFEYVLESLIHWKDSQRLTEISHDARRGQQLLVGLGYIPSGCRPPRGFRVEIIPDTIEGRKRNLRKWTPDSAIWPLAQRAWTMRLAGASLDENWRETHLYKSPECFSTFFSNTAYKGEVWFGGALIQVPALVTPDQWQQVNERAQHRAGGAYPRRQSSRFLLSGLLHCGACGGALCGDTVPDHVGNDGHRRQRWDYYVCLRYKRGECTLHRIAAREMDETVVSALFRDVLTEDNLRAQVDALAARLEQERPVLEAKRATLMQTITKTERAIQNILTQIEDAPSRELSQRLVQREQELTRLRSEVAAINAQLTQWTATPPDIDRARALCDELREALRASATPLARRLIKSIVAEIVVHDDHSATMSYHIPF